MTAEIPAEKPVSSGLEGLSRIEDEKEVPEKLNTQENKFINATYTALLQSAEKEGVEYVKPSRQAYIEACQQSGKILQSIAYEKQGDTQFAQIVFGMFRK